MLLTYCEALSPLVPTCFLFRCARSNFIFFDMQVQFCTCLHITLIFKVLSHSRFSAYKTSLHHQCDCLKFTK